MGTSGLRSRRVPRPASRSRASSGPPTSSTPSQRTPLGASGRSSTTRRTPCHSSAPSTGRATSSTTWWSPRSMEESTSATGSPTRTCPSCYKPTPCLDCTRRLMRSREEKREREREREMEPVRRVLVGGSISHSLQHSCLHAIRTIYGWGLDTTTRDGMVGDRTAKETSECMMVEGGKGESGKLRLKVERRTAQQSLLNPRSSHDEYRCEGSKDGGEVKKQNKKKG